MISTERRIDTRTNTHITVFSTVLAAVLVLAGSVLDVNGGVQDRTALAITDGKFLQCDDRSLKGDFAVIGSGFAAPPTQTPVPFATISLMTLDGEGNLINKVTRSNNGFISRGNDLGTYTVNPDCTGTIVISTPNPPFQLTFDLVIADMLGSRNAREFYFIATTPGGVVAASAKQIK